MRLKPRLQLRSSHRSVKIGRGTAVDPDRVSREAQFAPRLKPKPRKTKAERRRIRKRERMKQG